MANLVLPQQDNFGPRTGTILVLQYKLIVPIIMVSSQYCYSCHLLEMTNSVNTGKHFPLIVNQNFVVKSKYHSTFLV